MTNEKNFDEKFMELGEYYNIDSPCEVKEFLKSNEGIITLLNEAKPYLEETFSDDRYCLEMVYDPECISCNQLVLKIYVLFERYQNGAHQDIERIRYHLRPTRRKIQVFTEFSIMADVKNV